MTGGRRHTPRLWTRGTSTRALSGIVAGALTGTALYIASRLEGEALFLVVGATAGLVSAFALQAYSRSVQLTEVTVTIPQLSELRFLVSRDGRQAAWKLFVETVTRVSVQPLEDDAGLLREALTSLYGLFQTTRESLKSAQPSKPSGDGPTVEQLAITMLNCELRPFLSRWHPRLATWERDNNHRDESAWPEAATCRAELKQVQEHLHQYALGYARLAGVADAATLLRTDM